MQGHVFYPQVPFPASCGSPATMMMRPPPCGPFMQGYAGQLPPMPRCSPCSPGLYGSTTSQPMGMPFPQWGGSFPPARCSSPQPGQMPLNPYSPRGLPPLDYSASPYGSPRTLNSSHHSGSSWPAQSRARQNVVDPQPQPMFMPAAPGPKMICNGNARTHTQAPVHAVLGFDPVRHIQTVTSPHASDRSCPPMYHQYV